MLWRYDRRGTEVPAKIVKLYETLSLLRPANGTRRAGMYTTIKLQRVTDCEGGNNEHSLQLVDHDLRRSGTYCITVVDV